MEEFVSGAIMMAYTTTGAFFYRYWIKSNDMLFKLFSYAFFILAIERIVWLLAGSTSEVRPIVYLHRLAAFILIIIAILSKNRKTT